MTFLGNIYRTIPLLIRLKLANNKQHKIIQTERSVYPTWCSKTLQRRMDDYALRATLIIGEGFALLRNQSLTHEERKRFAYLGFIAPNIDNLTDQPNVKEDQLHALVTVPNQFFTLNEVEQLCAKLLITCHDEMPFPNDTKRISSKLIKAQVESQLQRSHATSMSHIESITYAKGGCSVQLFCSLMHHPKTQQEDQCAMQLGYLIQLLDDWFDMFTDQQEGVRTLANNLQVEAFIALFETEWKNLKHLVHQTAYSKSQRKKALNYWYLFFSTAFMYYGQLKRNGVQKLSNQPEVLNHPISLKWNTKDMVHGMWRGLTENFSES